MSDGKAGVSGSLEPPVPSLLELSLQAAAAHEFWRVQRRQLAYLPEDAANELLRRLLEQRRISPPQLELFRHCATSVSLAGPGITGPWLPYLGDFSALRKLRLHRCSKLRDTHLQHLSGLSPTLQLLDITGCTGLGDGAVLHLTKLTALQEISLSSTSISSPAAIASLCSALTQLTSLDLSELPADDTCCQAIELSLPQLQRLVLASTAVGDEGIRQLEQLRRLTALDISLTQVHCPPACPTLRELHMNSCSLNVQDESAQEAVWLQLGASLPNLKDLQLAHSTLLSGQHGEQLLQQLLAGAAGSLRSLNLRECFFSGNLASLTGATQMTSLDLSGTPVADCNLEDLALLPLASLSLAGTAVGDDGIEQLVTMTSLCQLDLSNTRVTDSCLTDLEQLSLLAQLDLTGSHIAFSPSEGQRQLGSLTSLRLNPSLLDDRGCRHLAAAAWQLRWLWLGSKAVQDKGLKALCALPKLEHLQLFHCAVSDPGLLSALPRCPTLTHLSLNHCWLASTAGLATAAAAALQSGGNLSEVVQDGMQIHIPVGKLAGTPTQRPTSAGRQASASRGRSGAGVLQGDTLPASGTAGSGISGRERLRAAPLTPEVLAHDERISYSREELLSLAQPATSAATTAPSIAARPGSAAAASQAAAAALNVQRLRQHLPPDLRSLLP